MTNADPIVSKFPPAQASASDWVEWFYIEFLPAWIARAKDPVGIGFFDLLDENAAPPQSPSKTVLAQARLLFTFAHLALLSGNPIFKQAAQVAYDALPCFVKPNGLYRREVARDGTAIDDPAHSMATSYDQCFIILALSTWDKLQGTAQSGATLEGFWNAIETHLIDPQTGLLLEHDLLSDPRDPSAPQPAQNPHMHMYEAALQAFEMTQDPVWLSRAQRMRAKGIAYFFDQDSGTITEFIAPDLSVLTGRAGQRREIGHQCEWAWLLLREVDLGGDPTVIPIAQRLLAFADEFGFASDGAMAGAAFDAVGCDATWREDRFLMWPQTEAIKTYAVRADQDEHADKARTLLVMVFRQYFAQRPAFVNQLDAKGQVIWSEALSRLHYHLVLALTEGARANLWPQPR